MERREYRKLHAEWYEYLSNASPTLGAEIAFWTGSIEAVGVTGSVVVRDDGSGGIEKL